MLCLTVLEALTSSPMLSQKWDPSDFTLICNKKKQECLGLFSRIECTARTSESSEELLQEEPEQRVVELEDESSDKDAQAAPEAQSRLEKQDGGKVRRHSINKAENVLDRARLETESRVLELCLVVKKYPLAGMMEGTEEDPSVQFEYRLISGIKHT